jgi:hypothetical protein
VWVFQNGLDTNPILSKTYTRFVPFYEKFRLVCEIAGQPYIIDFKTGQNVWPEYELQVSAYKHALEDKGFKLAILQVGYKRNKAGWKFTEIEDKFDLFL